MTCSAGSASAPRLNCGASSSAWLVLLLMCYPYVYIPVAARLRQLPSSLEESARLLGDSALAAFWRISLPYSATAIGGGHAARVPLHAERLRCSGRLMRYDTLTRAIATNHLADPPAALALSLMLLVLATVVVLAERWFSRRLPDGSRASGSQPATLRLGPLGARWRLPPWPWPHSPAWAHPSSPWWTGPPAASHARLAAGGRSPWTTPGSPMPPSTRCG